MINQVKNYLGIKEDTQFKEVLMERCVVLNGDYTFLNTVSWKRAIRLFMNGKIEVLKYADKILHCANGSEIPIPLVARLIKVIRLIYKNRVPYSKKNIMIRDKHTCMYCGKKPRKLTIDHIIPISRGGKSTFENCVAACQPCNNKKGKRTPIEANMFLKKRPYAPTISEFFRIKMEQLGLHEYLKELGVY
jgi:5-methylcytosine-specific restriction endonuclease McrA